MSGKFYVYEHWRPDRGECFYVGLGQGYRANIMRGRNYLHKAIRRQLRDAGLAVEVKIIAMGLTREEAISKEIERIAFWRNDGAYLCNLTAGGAGNLAPSEATRALMRKAKIGRKLSEEHKQKIRASVYRTYQNEEIRRKCVASKDGIERSRVANIGKKQTPEHIAKKVAAVLGRKNSEATRKLMSERAIAREARKRLERSE
jgi:NUMOD3 motif